MRKSFMRITSLIIILSVLLCTFAFAVESRESRFITSTSGSVYSCGNGQIGIEFTVTGTNTMTKIGAYAISIYKSDGTLQRTISYTESGYENMMDYNTFSHSSSITYNGTSGQSYYAIITCYAENSNGFAKIPYTTNTVTA